MTDTTLAIRNDQTPTTYEPEATKALWISMGEKGMTAEHARVLGLIGKHYQLDPAVGEIIIMGGKAYVTAEGYATLAERHPQYNGMELWPLSEAERKAIKAGPDDHAWGCRIHRKDRPFPVVGYGVSNVNNISMSTIKQFARELAETRAIRRAMRMTFRVNVPPDLDFIEDAEDFTKKVAYQVTDTDAGFAPPAEPAPQWDVFWGQMAAYGVTEDEVHSQLRVDSMKDYNGSLSWATTVMDSYVKQRDTPRVDPDENRGHSIEEMRTEYRGLFDKANVLGKPIDVGKLAWPREELADRLVKARQHVRGLELQAEFAGMAAQ